MLQRSPSWAGIAAAHPVLSYITLGLFAVLGAYNTELTVTEERVLMQRGILRVDTFEFQIDDIEQVNTSQNIIESWLGTGRVQFSTGATTPQLSAGGITDPGAVVQAIRVRQ